MDGFESKVGNMKATNAASVVIETNKKKLEPCGTKGVKIEAECIAKYKIRDVDDPEHGYT